MRISDWSSDVCSSDLHGPFLDDREALVELRQALLGCRPFRVLDQLLAAAELHQRRPARRLDDDVDVVVRAVALGADAPARLPAARGVAGARRGFADGAVRGLRLFLERPGAENPQGAKLGR